MEVPIIVVFLGILIFGAHLFNILFTKTKVPNALWFLLIGIVIGPVLGLVHQGHFGAVGRVFTNITLVIVLFESGVNLKLRELGGAIGSASLLTVTNFLITSALTSVIAYYFTSLDNMVNAAFFGVIIGGTSSAVVIPIIKQLKINPKGETVLLLESALSDVLCLVIGLAVLGAMQKGIFDMGEMLDMVWKSFLLAALIGIAAGLVWSVFLDRVRKIQNYTFTNLAMVFVVAGLTDLIGLNGGIATLAFGVTLGNAHVFKQTFLKKIIPSKELLQTEKSFFAEIAFILQTYFFVYAGVSIKFGNPFMFLLGLIMVIIIIAIRPLTVRVFVREKMSFKDLAIMGVMSPKGLVPAILASIPLQLGIEGGHIIQDLAYSVVLFSILLCSILVIILSKDPFALGFLKGILFRRSTEYVEEKHAGEGEQLTDGAHNTADPPSLNDTAAKG